MTFKKLSEDDKAKINEFKEKHGKENLGAYRALLMRGVDSKQALETINKRNNMKPIAEVPEVAKPKPKGRAKKQIPPPPPTPEESKSEPMEVDDVKAPKPKPRPKKEKIKKEQFEKKKENIEETTIGIVI